MKINQNHLIKWPLSQIIFQTNTEFKLQIKREVGTDRRRIKLYSIKSCGCRLQSSCLSLLSLLRDSIHSH